MVLLHRTVEMLENLPWATVWNALAFPPIFFIGFKLAMLYARRNHPEEVNATHEDAFTDKAGWFFVSGLAGIALYGCYLVARHEGLPVLESLLWTPVIAVVAAIFTKAALSVIDGITQWEPEKFAKGLVIALLLALAVDYLPNLLR